MKERLMTRSGKYHGNPLHKYLSRGRGRGVLYKVLYVLAPLQGPTPHPFIYHFWQKRGPLSYTFHWQIVLLSCTYWVYATGRRNWRQEDGKTFVLDKRDRAIASMFCRDLHLTSPCSGLFQKICLKKGEVWRKSFSNIVILTFVTQGVLSSFVLCSIAHVHWGQSTEAKFKLGH